MFSNATRATTLLLLGILCVVGASVQFAPAEQAAEERPVYRLASVQQSVASRPAPEQPGPLGLAELEEDEEPSSQLARARAFSAAFADVAERVTPAVVQVRTERTVEDIHGGSSGFGEIFDRLPDGHPAPEAPHVSDGSGFLVSSDGLILTNHHVIAGASRIRVILRDKRVFDASVVGADPTTDLALLRLDAQGLPYAQLGDSESLRVGEWVLAIGNPGFRDDNTLAFTVTSGIVSATGRPLNVIQEELRGSSAAAYAIEDFIQTDAAINPGNSGGPMVDLSGRVVGINTAIASANGVNQGYGFAVPISVAKRVMEDLLSYGHVRRPLLGISIQNITPEDAEVYGLPRIAGVLIEDFASESPARQAGLQRHDVIVAIDGAEIDRLGQFQRLVAQHQPGETVEVDVIRFGERLRARVKLTEANLGRDAVVRTAPERKSRNSSEGIGLELIDLTPSLARERRFREPGGALIGGVAPASTADRKNVPVGVVIREINRRPISSADEAERILQALPSGAVASLLLELPQGTTMIRNVRVP